MLHRTHSPNAQHILTYAQHLRGGGVERALLRMVRGWLEEGRRVTLVLGSAGGPLASELPPGIELRVIGSRSYRKLLLSLADHARASDPDLIFCPGNHYSGVAAITWLLLGARRPVIVGKVSNALVRPELGAFMALVYRCWLRLHPIFLDHLVAMTPAMAAEATATMRMPADRISVIANPPTKPRPDAAPVAIPDGRYLIGVGRLEPQKRWDRLLKALPRLADKRIKLLLLGEGKARRALEAQVRTLGLSGRVSMPGHADDPLPALERAAVAVLTSDYEGVPGVLREALSVGTPVVVTESSVAIREIVTSPELGTVIARKDAKALVAALDHWLAPGRARPAPVAMEGDPAAEYLAMFDSLVEAQPQP